MSNPLLKQMFRELARTPIPIPIPPRPPKPAKLSMVDFAAKINEIEAMEDFAGRQQARNQLAEAIKYGLVVLDRRTITRGPRVAFERLN